MPTLLTIAHFDGFNGASAFGNLTFGPAGDLIGTTTFGGANDGGTVFSITNINASYSDAPVILANLGGANGEFPTGGLLVDRSGSLIGTTQAGGVTGTGTVFELSKASGGYASTPTILANLNSTTGTTPFDGMIADAAGDLFGTASSGGTSNDGTVFEIPRNDSGYAAVPVTVADFNGGNGNAPTGSLIIDDAGDLFGTTQKGGSSGLGTVFEVPFVNGAYVDTPVTLVSFDGANGQFPMSSLAMDGKGDLFGTAREGGPASAGTVFEIPRTSSGYADAPITLASFMGSDGQFPESNLIIDSEGNLFGTTSQGGASDDGTVFEIPYTDQGYDPAPMTLISFDGTNGRFPRAGLISDPEGNLFGTTVGDGTPDNSATVFEVTDTGFRAICYTEGTHLLTPHGEEQIEHLRPGDLVLTVSNGLLTPRPIKWLGYRRIHLLRSLDMEGLAPICISKDAVGPSIPHRDLLVSPDHAIFIDGKLICARQLVNGTTIYRLTGGRSITYYHVQFDCHTIVVAEGLTAESYVDTGNSGFFVNASIPNLYPDVMATCPRTDLRRETSCAPFVSDEANVLPVWHSLACRAASLGQPVPKLATTRDPDLRILLAAREVKPIAMGTEWALFVLPRWIPEVRLVSRAQLPTEARPWLDDSRQLGVRVTRLIIRTGDDINEIPVDHPSLIEGWWAVEADGPGMLRRWTNGNAVLPLPEMREFCTLEILFCAEMVYRCELGASVERGQLTA